MVITPWRQLRRSLLGVTLVGACAATVASAIASATLGPAIGTDILVGACVVLVPQLWFYLRGVNREAGQQSAWLALGKFALCAAGYGLWFATVPQATLLATLLGTVIAIVTTTALTALLAARVNR